jgi:hypothetical protein
MTVGVAKASIFALRKEVTAGTYLAPSSATQFVALRKKSDVKFSPQMLKTDELLNDIGETKELIGKTAVKGNHSAYLRHSGVEGQEPQLGILYESLMGAKSVASVEYPLVSASTTTVLKVNTGVGANFIVGQALLIKDTVNGYSIRNISSISGDNLTLNFALAVAPLTGVNLGKAILYSPVATGHPTFSTTKYLGNGFAVESSSGNTVTDLSIKADAAAYGEVDFGFEGINYLLNSITIASNNKYLDLIDDIGTFAVSIPEGVYASPIDVAAALQLSLLNAHPAKSYVVTYSNTAGTFTITSSSALLTLKNLTGANTANSIAATIGFTLTDHAGAVTYTSDSAQSYTAAYTPSYDVADIIVVKGAELMVGTSSDNISLAAQTIGIKISKKVIDVDAINAVSGIQEKVAESRSVEMTVTSLLKKYDAELLDALLKNTGISAMLNCGPKSGSNWIPGQCFNVYMKSCTVGDYAPKGENFLQVEIKLKGYVTSTSKDVYLGFL